MNITFASYVGNQTDGIKSCLTACMDAKDEDGINLYSIDKLLLSYTVATKQNAEDLRMNSKKKAILPLSYSIKTTMMKSSKML